MNQHPYGPITKLACRGKNICLLLLVTLFSLALLEGSLQLLFRLRTGTWLHDYYSAFRVGYTQPVDDRRQYALRPNYRDEKRWLTVDENGFRSNGHHRMLSDKVVVVLGDSVPFGPGVSDDFTYPAILEALLTKSYLTHHVGVLNAAVPSYNLCQSYDRLRYDVLREVDVTQIAVVTVQAANDISLLTHYRQRWTRDITWADGRWYGTWERHTNLAIEHYFAQVTKRICQEEEHHEKYPSTEMLNNVRATLRELDVFARTNGVPIILMPVNPFYYQTTNTTKNDQLRFWLAYREYVEVWGKLVDQFNSVLKTTSQTSDMLFFFDTRPILDKTDRDLCYMDFIHLSIHGHRLVAEWLLEYMKKWRLMSSQTNIENQRIALGAQ